MDNPNETVIDKAVNFVKDVFGIQHDMPTEIVAKPENHDAEREAVAESASSLDPDAYVVDSAGVVAPSSQLTPGTFATPMGQSDAERLRREVGEYPREKSAAELRAESAFHEDNG